MKEYQLFIGGTWTPAASGHIDDDLNPATGEVYARVHQGRGDDVRRAIDAAAAAAPAWAATAPGAREGVLLRAADELAARREEIAEVLIDEAGATFGKAMFETGFVVDLLRSAAGECRRICGETIPSDSPGLWSLTVRRPLGVIAGISPFNFPLLLSVKKLAFALAAGNSFVLKPAEETAVVGLKIAELFHAAGLPAGVLNVVPGPGRQTGEALLADPRVRMITFTGSTAVGRELAVAAARQMKKITLEMGGKSPLLVLADADADYAVNAACFGIFLHQGQVCMANSRIIVEAPLFETFCERFTAKVATLKVGNPREHDTVIGPLIRASQCELIDGHVQDAVAKGARLLAGGTASGNFYRPTVLAGVTPAMRVYSEESFGPVVSIFSAADEDEALRIANDTAYGLSSAVITRDIDRALALSLQLEAGMVHVNDSTAYDEPNVPFGGVKNSGMGREGGHYSIEEMTELKWITIQTGKRHFPF